MCECHVAAFLSGTSAVTDHTCLLLQSIAVFFSRLGTVTAVRLGPENHGVRRAWAEFQSEDEAKLALQYNQQACTLLYCMSPSQSLALC